MLPTTVNFWPLRTNFVPEVLTNALVGTGDVVVALVVEVEVALVDVDVGAVVVEDALVLEVVDFTVVDAVPGTH